MSKSLENVYRYIVYLVIFLLPLIVAPISTNPFLFPKNVLLVFGTGVLLLMLAFWSLAHGKLEFKYTKFDLSLVGIALVYVLSTVFRSPNKMEALLLPGTTTTVVFGVILYLLINQISDKSKLVMTIVASATVYSILTIFAQLKVLQSLTFLPETFRGDFFTPGGGYLPSAIFLGSTIPLILSGFLGQKDIRLKILNAIMGVFILFGLGLSAYQLSPGKPFELRTPSYSVSWSIASDAIKTSPLLGVGPGNYLTAFNQFRPVTYNATELWSVKFSTATNFVLTSITETGLLGLAALAFFGIMLGRVIKEDFKQKKLVGWGVMSSPLAVSVVLMIVAFLLLPITNFLVAYFLIILAVSTKTKSHTVNLALKDPENPHKASRLPAIVMLIPTIALVSYVFYSSFRYVKAENHFRTAVLAVSQNDAMKAYDSMLKAIQANPQVDRYHMAFSQLNLALANSIAANATGEDAREITEEERNQIIQLIQQSIQEAKAGVATNPTRAGNWELMARTYQAIIPLANGADLFALQSFNQAIILDPNNPGLRVDVGGLFFGAQDFESARRAFELAISIKPDYANARFNLAFALNSLGELDAAIEQMSLVISLVEANSNDYQIARQAMEAFENQKALTVDQGEDLTIPEEEGDKILEPPIELGEDEGPPSEEELPITPQARNQTTN